MSKSKQTFTSIREEQSNNGEFDILYEEQEQRIKSNQNEERNI